MREQGPAGSLSSPARFFFARSEAPPVASKKQRVTGRQCIFSSIVIHRWWRRERNNDPRCRYHNRTMIRPYWSYDRSRRPCDPRLVGRRRKITSSEQDRRCCQREKYCDLFHGFISSIKQVRSPCSERILQEGLGLHFDLAIPVSSDTPVCRRAHSHRKVCTPAFLFLFLFFLFLYLHFQLYRRRTLIAVSIGTLLILLVIVRRNIAAAKDGRRDCQGKEGADFFMVSFTSFWGWQKINQFCRLQNRFELLALLNFYKTFYLLSVSLRTTRFRWTVVRFWFRFRQWRRAVAAVIPGFRAASCRSRSRV